MDAQEFAVAREVLEPLAATPTRRVAALMAELERKQHGDEGRARAWMVRALRARRDPAWTADGFVSERWLPASPITGHLDAFEWKDPLAGDEPAGVLIEAEEATARPAPAPAETQLQARTADKVEAPAPEARSAPAEAQEYTEIPSEAGRQPQQRTMARIPVAPAIIPLVHAPDDPGPEPESFNGRGRNGSKEPAADNWTRIRQLFRH
jgi:HemY protein